MTFSQKRTKKTKTESSAQFFFRSDVLIFCFVEIHRLDVGHWSTLFVFILEIGNFHVSVLVPCHRELNIVARLHVDSPFLSMYIALQNRHQTQSIGQEAKSLFDVNDVKNGYLDAIPNIDEISFQSIKSRFRNSMSDSIYIWKSEIENSEMTGRTLANIETKNVIQRK